MPTFCTAKLPRSFPDRHFLRLLICLLTGFAVTSVASATKPPVTAIVFSPDGEYLLAASQTGVTAYTWPQLEPKQQIDALAANLHCLAFSPNGKLLAVGGGEPAVEGLVEIFSWPAGQPVAAVSQHADSVTDIAWLNNAQYLSASLDRVIHLCDWETTESLQSFRGHSRGITGLCLLEGNQTLVSVGDDQSVRVWDAKGASLIRSLNQHTKPIHAIASRPQSEGLPLIATAAADRTIRFWQPTIGRMVRYIRLESKPLNITWLPDSSTIVASCTDGQVRLIDPVNVKVLQVIPAIDGWAYTIAVHPQDGSIAVGGTNGQLRRIELAD